MFACYCDFMKPGGSVVLLIPAKAEWSPRLRGRYGKRLLILASDFFSIYFLHSFFIRSMTGDTATVCTAVAEL